MDDKYKDKRPEYWRAHKEKVRKIKMGLINPNLKDFFETRISITAPALNPNAAKWTAKFEQIDTLKAMADKAQKEIRREWAHKGNTNFIIVIEWKNVRKDKANFSCEVHQLRMDKEKTAEFAEICEKFLVI